MKSYTTSLKEISKAEIKRILDEGDKVEIRELFGFDLTTPDDMVLLKFRLFSAYFFPQYFKVKDAPFHSDIDKNNLAIYRGTINSFVDGAFRGAAKTTRTKLFRAFVIACDRDHFRRFLKVATKDGANAKQIVTDIYNMLAVGRVRLYYPEIFERTTIEKRQEAMGVFVTSTGVKLLATTVIVDQRGQIQEEVRPDEIWFDDFETRKTLRSAVETKAIWDNMEEARTGLAFGGGVIYTCNYISERGNVHKLITPRKGRVILLTPIISKEGKIAWPARYTMDDINQIKADAEDFEGEYLNEPSAGADVYFDREILKLQPVRVPKKTIGNRKIFFLYNPSHAYGIGSDVGGGLGLDHSADVTIDFTTIPARVVSTFKDNLLKPDLYGHELLTQGQRYGECLIGPENNKYDTVIQVLRSNDYPEIYFTEVPSKRAGMPPKTRTYGWNTNGATKYTMMAELKAAVEDGLLELSDPDLIQELKSYTRDDVMDRDEDVRLTTRHFDLLIACAIAWQMRKYAKAKGKIEEGSNYEQPAYEAPTLDG